MNLCCWWHLPRPPPLSAEAIAALPEDQCLSVNQQACFRIVSTLNNDIYDHGGVVWTGLENITESQIKSVTWQHLSTLNGPRPPGNRVFLISASPVASGHFEFNIFKQKSSEASWSVSKRCGFRARWSYSRITMETSLTCPKLSLTGNQTGPLMVRKICFVLLGFLSSLRVHFNDFMLLILLPP